MAPPAAAEVAEHSATAEFRFDAPSRLLTGDVVTYDRVAVVAGVGLERFAPGSIHPNPAGVGLNLFHGRDATFAHTDDNSLRLFDSPSELRIEADVAERSAAWWAIQHRAVGSLSLEFAATAEHRDADGVRTVTEATLNGIGLVHRSPYRGRIELRHLDEMRAAGEWLTGVIPYSRRLQCECAGPACQFVEFEPGSLADAGADGDVLAVTGNFMNVLGSLRRGTLRLRETDDGLEVGLTDASTPAARTVIEGSKVADIFVRPLVDEVASVTRDVAITLATGRPSAVRTFQHTSVRAILIKPTTASDGHQPARIDAEAAPEAPEAPVAAPVAGAAGAAGAGQPGEPRHDVEQLVRGERDDWARRLLTWP